MTSFGGTTVIQENCMPTFKTHGQIYQHIYLTGSLLPTPNSDYKFFKFILSQNDQRCVLVFAEKSNCGTIPNVFSST